MLFIAELLRTFNKLQRIENLQERNIVCNVTQMRPAGEHILGETLT